VRLDKTEARYMDVVIDTNVLVSGLFWKGKPSKILECCKTREHTNYISPKILLELEKVLAYDKFKLATEEIGKAIRIVLSFSRLVIPNVEVMVIETDPSDNMFIECALASGAKYIISGDEHLLKLKKWYGIRIVSCSELLAEIQQR